MADDLLCAVPARGGSKRLPRKNVLDLAGKPMIAYTIEAALDADSVGEVYVCTDDEEIAAVAEEYDARVPVQIPDELCGDMVPSHEPCQYLAEYLEREHGETHDHLLCLQPTSPLRSPSDIDEGIAEYADEDYEFLLSVTHIDPHYFHWAVEPKGDGYWDLYFGEQYMKERAELPDVYRPNGSIKIADLDALSRVGHFFGERVGAVETPRERSIHVGTRFDFDLCEHLLSGARE